MKQVIDTSVVASSEAATYLAEAMVGTRLPFINVSESRFDSPSFRARFEEKMLGDAVFTALSLDSVRLKRMDREICRHPSAMLLIAVLHSGSYDQSFDYHPSFSATRPSDILIIDLDAPQSVTFAGHALLTCAYIPRRDFEPFLGSASILKPVLIRPNNELHGLLTASFMASAAMREPSAVASHAALHTVTRLAMIAHGLHPLSCDELRSSVLDARRIKAQRFIASQCSDSRLDAQRVADNLGISLRSLHLAFEPTGAGVSMRIMAARLGYARQVLLQFPSRTVLSIALQAGFNNLSTFYRGFVREYGMPPDELRRTVGARRLP